MRGSGEPKPAVSGLRELADEPGGLAEGQEEQSVGRSPCLLCNGTGVGRGAWHGQPHREQPPVPDPGHGKPSSFGAWGLLGWFLHQTWPSPSSVCRSWPGGPSSAEPAKPCRCQAGSSPSSLLPPQPQQDTGSQGWLVARRQRWEVCDHLRVRVASEERRIRKCGVLAEPEQPRDLGELDNQGWDFGFGGN